jgi:hypothetical protein
MGTDYGAPGSAHGDSAGELALLVEAGLSPQRALQAGTTAWPFRPGGPVTRHRHAATLAPVKAARYKRPAP